MNTRTLSHRPKPVEAPAERHEVLGLVSLAASLGAALSLISYDARGGDNWVGPTGAWFANVLVSAFGLSVWLFPLELFLASLRWFGRPGLALGASRIASLIVLSITTCAFWHLACGDVVVFGSHPPGGVFGQVTGEVLRSFVGTVGAHLVVVTLFLVTLVLRTRLSLLRVTAHIAQIAVRSFGWSLRGARMTYHAWNEAKKLEQAERKAVEAEDEPKIVPFSEDTISDNAETTEVEDGDPAQWDVEPAVTILEKEQVVRTSPVVVLSGEKNKKKTLVKSPSTPPAADFVLPPTTLLAENEHQIVAVDPRLLKQNAQKLVEKLAAYGVQGRVDEIHPGPVVTMYELEPASGTKISKIASLSDDLAMALAAQKVRIVAPIPGKARVGFELPNVHRQTVGLREILEDEKWIALRAALPLAFGKDIAGQPVYGDLSKMPHLLVAGATGSGKSVGINVMLVSLLAKKSPEEVRLLMIDPKVVELAVFDGIPHMLLPVVTDMKKAALALRWAVDEMERRYQLFADAGARNIETYNERVEKVLRGELAPEKLSPRRAGKVRAQGADGEEVLLAPDEEERPDAVNEKPNKLAHIVVVVDEFADLMMVAAKDVEAAIARLAQKARAAGIHVILATQRPSVDVITGMIKANFPARVAFKVSQREDSKTILGRTGAEHLLGMGDMLMIPPGSGDLKRVHCAYVSEDEVKAVCDHLRAQGVPQYDNEILKPRDDENADGSSSELGSGSDDPLYDRAVALVAQAGYCSISHVQRHLNLGYNKAAKLVERMEKEGVVGPPNGKAGGRREVRIQPL